MTGANFKNINDINKLGECLDIYTVV